MRLLGGFIQDVPDTVGARGDREQKDGVFLERMPRWSLEQAEEAERKGGKADDQHDPVYQRGRLAHPTMTQAVDKAAAEHVHAVHEGAAGGGTVAESGCGCN